MFGVSFLELAVIFAVALIVFGPDKLPEIARSLGKIMGDLQRSGDQLRREFYRQIYSAPEIKTLAEPESPSASEGGERRSPAGPDGEQ